MAAERRLLAAAIAVLVLAGCGGAADESADDLPVREDRGAAAEASTTTTSTTEAGDPVEEAILAGYRAGWDAFGKAMDPPNPDHPALAATSTGRALEQSRKYLAEIKARGNTLRGPIVLDPVLKEHTVDTAVIWDCVQDSANEVPATSSEQAGTPVQIGWEVRMKLDGRVWKQESLFETEAACLGR